MKSGHAKLFLLKSTGERNILIKFIKLIVSKGCPQVTRICLGEKMFLHIQPAVKPEKNSGKVVLQTVKIIWSTMQQIDWTVLLTFER